MRIYFSGGRGLQFTPEVLIPKRKPHIMLTYYDIESNGTMDRYKVYKGRVANRTYPDRPIPKKAYTESMFMDSGAYSLYNLHVLGLKPELGEHGRLLDRGRVRRSQGDFSWYDLRKGSEFRKYCDGYARWMRAAIKRGVICTTVDVITNPDLSWEVCRFFEEEHGLRPLPVIHAGTHLKYVDKYLEAGHEFLGVGGLGFAFKVNSYVKWADPLFRHLCPASNGYKPKVRTHGFAMTSWPLIYRYPWWSVDSATWVKLAAYGWILVPKWEDGKFTYDSTPLQMNISRKPTERKHKYWWRIGVKSPRQTKDRHIDNCKEQLREDTMRWLEHLGIELGSYDKKGEMKVFGVTSHFRARACVNLIYLKNLEESRPDWPHALDNSVVTKESLKLRKGFGL